MKIELRTNRDGSKYYSFIYYDRVSKKPIRISKDHIHRRFGKDIIDHSEAIDVCKILEAESDSVQNRIKKRIKWEDEYYNFRELLGFYEAHQKKKAPNKLQK